jgi:hypothetical protein
MSVKVSNSMTGGVKPNAKKVTRKNKKDSESQEQLNLLDTDNSEGRYIGRVKKGSASKLKKEPTAKPKKTGSKVLKRRTGVMKGGMKGGADGCEAIYAQDAKDAVDAANKNLEKANDDLTKASEGDARIAATNALDEAARMLDNAKLAHTKANAELDAALRKETAELAKKAEVTAELAKKSEEEQKDAPPPSHPPVTVHHLGGGARSSKTKKAGSKTKKAGSKTKKSGSKTKKSGSKTKKSGSKTKKSGSKTKKTVSKKVN